MASALVDLVRAFIELDASGEGMAMFGLEAAYDFFGERTSDARWKSIQTAVAEADLQAFSELQNRAFPNLSFSEISGIEIEANIDFEPRGDDRNPLIPGLVDSIWRMTGQNGQSVGELFATENGLSPVEARKLFTEMLYADEAKGQRQDIALLSRPSLHRFLLRRFLCRLDHMVEEIERLEPLDLQWGEVAHLAILLSNAHDSALLGQDVACAVVCGTILEEAMKHILGRSSFATFSLGLKMLVEKNLLTENSPEIFAIRAVKEMRDKATHHPASFLADKSSKRKDVLVNTRYVLSKLFCKETL